MSMLNKIMSYLARRAQTGESAVFSVGKKILDLVDDLFDIIKHGVKSIPEIAAPIAGGALSAIVLLGEGWSALKELGEAYENEQLPQRKSRMLTSALSTAIAGIGLGLCAAIIAAVAGAVVAIGVTSMITLVTMAMTTIYSLALARQVYSFWVAKEEEKKAQATYEATLIANLPRLETLRHEIENAHNENEKAQKQAEYDRRQQEIENTKLHYQQCRSERLQAEREVAFSSCEVLASASVLTGTILAVSAFVGLSVASMGILPLAFIIAGVVLGIATKLLEHFDKKNDHKITTRLRNLFFGSKTTPEERVNIELSHRSRQMQTEVITRGMDEAHIIEEFAHGNLPEAKKMATSNLEEAIHNHQQYEESKHPSPHPVPHEVLQSSPANDEEASKKDDESPHIIPHE